MEQSDLLRHALDALEGMGVDYMLVGSFASTAYGEPRFTQDIDILANFTSVHVPGLVASFPAPEFYLSAPAAREAIRNRQPFNVLHPATGNKIDFIVSQNDEWSKSQFAKRQRVRLLPDREGFCARREDIILGKIVYYAEGGSEKHLRDIAGILRISREEVDLTEITRWAEKLGIVEVWQAIQSRMGDQVDPAPGASPAPTPE